MLKKDSNQKEILEKNLKLMSLSATILIVLFIYMLIKNGSMIEGKSYYIGLAFLFVLLFIALFAKFLRKKLIEKLPDSKFKEQLIKASKAQEEREETPVTTSNISQENLNIECVKSNVTFKDIAGIESSKEELTEIVDFLNNPKKYTKFNVRLPKGVLLVGPPGVGKTLIARAVAGEANVPFFYQSGASFVHIYVGMGAKRVRELFLSAKAKAPAIIFIDEIDAIGKSRDSKGNDEREATLNELLTQMDGFEGDNGIIVIAATNKIEVLDEALLRAGRFDRRVFIELPNIEDRAKIIELYLKKVSHNIDVNRLSSSTIGFSSAALSTLINEAILNMIKRDDVILNENDIEIAKEKIEYGKQEKLIFDDEQKNLIATFQATKAFVTKKDIKLFDNNIKLKEIEYLSISQIKELLKEYLSGHIGIEILLGQSYAIKPKELEYAKKIAKQMQETYQMIYNEKNLLDELKDELKDEISKNKSEILQIKELLLKDEEYSFKGL